MITNNVSIIGSCDCLQIFQKYFYDTNSNILTNFTAINLSSIYNNFFLPHNGHIRLSKNEISFFIHKLCESYMSQQKLIDKNIILMINSIHLKTHNFFILPLNKQFIQINSFKNISKIRIYSSIFYSIHYTIGCKIYSSKLKLRNYTKLNNDIVSCASVYEFVRLMNCTVIKQSGHDIYHAPYFLIKHLISQL